MRTQSLLIICVVAAFGPTRSVVGQADQPSPADSTEAVHLPGQVLNHLGAGIPEARITARLLATDHRPERMIAEARSNALGDFELKLPAGEDGRIVVLIQKEGFAPLRREYELPALPQDEFVEAVLVGARKLSGRVVVAESEQPIPEAVVTAYLGGRQVKTRSDLDGRFEISGIPPSGGGLKVAAPGYGTVSHPIDAMQLDQPFVIPLKRERVLRVKVLEEQTHKPISGALVELMVIGGDDHRAERTDQRGVTVFRQLNPDSPRLQVRLSHDDYLKSARFSDEIIPDPGELTPKVTLTMIRGGWIAGKVTDADDQPLFGARVEVVTSPPSFVPAQFSALDGSYRVTGLMPGKAIVTFHHSFNAPQLFEVDVDPDEPVTLNAKLKPGASIVARITGPDGKGLEGVRAVSTSWMGHDTLRIGGVTDQEGRLEIDHAPEGNIRFRLFTLETPELMEVVMKAGRTDYAFAVTPPAAGEQPAEAGSARPVFAAGTPVPDFSVKTLAGQTFSPATLRGRYVFLDFWATWCPPCVAELPRLKRLAEAMKDREDFVLLGISLDQDRAAVERFTRSRNVSWPQAAGAGSGAQRAATVFQVSAIPSTFLIGPDGRILATGLRGEGVVAAVRSQINASR